MNRILPRCALVALAATLAGCDTSGLDLEFDGKGGVTLSLAAGAPGTAPSTPGLASFTQTDGTNTLEITRVAVVLRKIELERESDDSCDGAGSPGDDCEEFEVGPILLEFPVDGSVTTAFTIEVPIGTYDEVEFEVHKPDDDDPGDAAFLTLHPEFEDVSIRVEGTFNDDPFVFLQDLNEEQEVALSPPIEVQDQGSPVNVTLLLDVTTWFAAPGTGALIDPASANAGGPNENLVRDRIRESIDVFEDDDENGERG